MEGFGTVHRLTQAQVDAGEATALSGVRIAIVDANGQKTGVVMESGAAGQAPSAVATQETIQAAVSGSLSKVTLPAGIAALTLATHQGKECHAEVGTTSISLAVANFALDAPAMFEAEVFNYTGSGLPITISGFSGGISIDGDTTNDDLDGTGTLITIPHAQQAVIRVDADGWVRVRLAGIEVTQAELDVALAEKMPIITVAVLNANHTSLQDNTLYVSDAQGPCTNAPDTSWAWSLYNLKMGTWRIQIYMPAGTNLVYRRSVSGTFTTNVWVKDAIARVPFQDYSATAAYAVGDQVIQALKLYKCKTAITVGEAFTAAKWDEISVPPAAVTLTGAQTVAGVKTFSDMPVLPSATPSGNEPVSAARLTTVLGGYTETGHGHTESQISGLVTDLAGKMPVIVISAIDANSTALQDNTIYIGNSTGGVTNAPNSWWAWVMFNFKIGTWRMQLYMGAGDVMYQRYVNGSFTGATWKSLTFA